MWKDDYRAGMEKLSAGAQWRAETLRRMEETRPRPVRMHRAAGLAACAAALALAVLLAQPLAAPQTAGAAVSSAAAAQQETAPAQQKISDAPILADTAPLQGTVLRWTDAQLVVDLSGREQTFLLDADSQVDPDAYAEGASVQVCWKLLADGTRYAIRVQATGE